MRLIHLLYSVVTFSCYISSIFYLSPQCVAMYKGRDPATAEEEEFMQNCFDLLCSCLMLQENKAAFIKVTT